MTTSELKPCPFCGYENPRIMDAYFQPEYAVVCPECHNGTGHSPDRLRVIEAWNRRVPEKEKVQA